MRPHGITFDKSRNRWKARIYVDGRLHTVGTYHSQEEAVREREGYARKTLPATLAERATGGHMQHRMDSIDIGLIRDLVSGGRSQRSVARELGVDRSWVCRVINGRRRALA